MDSPRCHLADGKKLSASTRILKELKSGMLNFSQAFGKVPSTNGRLRRKSALPVRGRSVIVEEYDASAHKTDDGVSLRSRPTAGSSSVIGKSGTLKRDHTVSSPEEDLTSETAISDGESEKHDKWNGQGVANQPKRDLKIPRDKLRLPFGALRKPLPPANASNAPISPISPTTPKQLDPDLAPSLPFLDATQHSLASIHNQHGLNPTLPKPRAKTEKGLVKGACKSAELLGRSGGPPSKIPVSKLSNLNPDDCGDVQNAAFTRHTRVFSSHDFRKREGPKGPKSLDDFYILQKMGAGGFASVYLVKEKHASGKYFAMKRISHSSIQDKKHIEQMENEVKIQMQLKHPFIVELHTAFQTNSMVCLVLEYMACGDLYRLLKKHKKFTAIGAKFYVAELVCTLEYLHSKNIIFRDIKPENILIDATGHIKLGDFGFAKCIKDTTHSLCGTPDYMAPEVLDDEPYSFSVDWWAVGVLTFELMVGHAPFTGSNVNETMKNVLTGNAKWEDSGLDPSSKIFISKMLMLDLRDRLGAIHGAEEIKTHPFFFGIKWNCIQSRSYKPPYLPDAIDASAIENQTVASGDISADQDIRRAETLASPSKYRLNSNIFLQFSSQALQP